jgi:proteasome lid subunit RPN8/RPN11
VFGKINSRRRVGMILKVKTEHLKLIRLQGEATYPSECCGLLLGRLEDGEKKIEEVFSVDNAREDGAQHNRFLIPPAKLLEAEKVARQKHLEILGFFHSHPEAEAKPSAFDLEHAWPFYSYVIVSVKERRAGDLNSWRMVNDRSRFEAEQIVVLD